ncbi:low affinity high capacity ammonium permease [Ophidiomyces ophidiicola]|uniref:Low affinity high capacity ammonium permease n=1 Tax=Ophidiomyces ophidiicola TaxID=1387563 RepID=A0ACB8UPB2_9EURO|nr:low affinity high capacity ammonium permease [Ophidiomyces ophidiicola]KAI1934519.1 low affinity high capacity ammonium permease [Ophidiomyces ophidiicola]KAI1948272.1 low affinity high capacity ammonium permease [Ophidiomyces ophidiicola]KAI1965731.1 low affinity high capacity ammonium permease [Ophidiomyces ophidiicola]KAI2009330.1 low affinity high capacity ammonium permease [Ophidiomyces ophidiicola]
MRVSVSLLTFALGLASAGSTKVGRGRTCGTVPTAEFMSITADFAAQEAKDGFTASNAMVTIDTYVHVVSSGSSPAQGNVPDRMVQDQIRVMNSDYAPHGFQFRLVDTTRTVNANWARDGNEMAMKRALRKGGYNTLNLYLLPALGQLLGYCYFPTRAQPGTETFIRDGCTIVSTSLPGGSNAPYNLGKTSTHEVGHWMGLLHTFEGGCSGSGDGVADTPAQRSASSGCPTGRDSCPGGGPDPIHNYMDYSDDRCMTEFTRGQGARMQNMWNQFRGR